MFIIVFKHLLQLVESKYFLPLPRTCSDISYEVSYNRALNIFSIHRLKPLDVEFMKRLHDKVNIIPMIAKADTLTPDECREFKKTVSQDLPISYKFVKNFKPRKLILKRVQLSDKFIGSEITELNSCLII